MHVLICLGEQGSQTAVIVYKWHLRFKVKKKENAEMD